MRLAFLLALAGCAEGSAPELTNVGDHTAVVGEELRLELDGTDPDGDRLTYGFRALDLPDLVDRATISVAPSGAGVFRWTPLAADVGDHAVDFTVSDGDSEVIVTVQITVVSSVTSPVFRAPLGSGTTLDLDQNDCLDLDIVVEDADTAQVTLAQSEPAIAGASLDQLDGQTGRWHWCPSMEQRAISRHTLVLSADDGQNPPTIKNYVIVLRGGGDVDPDPVCTDDTSEEDDDEAHARATTFPSFSSTANAICGGDDDFYKVPLFTGEKMIVNLTFTQSNPQEDLDLHLIKAGVDLTPCDETNPQLCTVAAGQSADSNEHTEFTVPSGCAPCDYFVVVRGFNGSAAPYAIAIEIQ
jgi:hypothetical protein